VPPSFFFFSKIKKENKILAPRKMDGNLSSWSPGLSNIQFEVCLFVFVNTDDIIKVLYYHT
jgi:hypothetical protein